MRFAHFLGRLSGGVEVAQAQRWSPSLVQLRAQPRNRFSQEFQLAWQNTRLSRGYSVL